MATFDFPFHKFSTENPDSSFRMKLGGSYQFTAAPSSPDQRIFKLRFYALKYFMTNGVLDKTIYPDINLARLEDFYALHKMWATFIYPHPVYGNLSVSFNKPLVIPEGVDGGDGAVQNIEVEFIERPGMQSSPETDLIQINYQDF
jgi:hypothetical protein